MLWCSFRGITLNPKPLKPKLRMCAPYGGGQREHKSDTHFKQALNTKNLDP